MQKGLRPRRSVRMAMSHEIMFYAIVQVCLPTPPEPTGSVVVNTS